MKSLKIGLIVTFIIGVIIGLNYYSYKTSKKDSTPQTPKLPAKEGVTDIEWKDMDNLQDINNKRIRILGAAYLLKSGILEDKINYFVLMPPAKADMCVPVTAPNIKEMIYVDCRNNPFSHSKYFSLTAQSLPLLYVEGNFKVINQDYMFKLTDTIITPFEK